MEGIDLTFTDDALNAIAKEAIKCKAGARGLRTIMETCMLEIMYVFPSLENVKECIVDDHPIGTYL